MTGRVGRIRDSDIALVRERSAIAEVVGEYLQLRNAGGGSLKGLCPFHEEKTPSFNVTPARGLWYCFACDEGGDVISFVARIDHLSFAEAVERLAARAGIELRYEQGGSVPGREQSQRRRLIEAHRAARDFYCERLTGADAATARDFLFSRGFALADADRFGVGYAPAEWDALVRHLRARGYTDAELLLGGLAREGRRGPVDRFRGRLMWPIRDLSGEVIAFGARRLADDDDGPKYLNTPETPLFKKSSVLYGADLAKREIAQRRQAVVVEGYTDVMACHLAGVPTAVATSGTSFGDGHIAILRRLLMDADTFRGEVIFTFDGDAAGQRAALRAFSMEERFVTQTFVAVQGDGLDPCELRLARGDAAVRELVASRVPLFEFAIRSALGNHDLNTAEGRLAALDAAAPIVARIKDEGLRQLYAISLDRWLGTMNEEFVLARVHAHAGPAARRARGGNGRDQAALAGRPSRPRAAGENGGRRDPVVQVEREALKLAVQRPALAGPAFDALGEDVFTAAEHAEVFRLVAACGGTGAGTTDREWAEKLRASATDDRLRGLVTRLAVEPLLLPPRADGEADARYAGAVLARLEELAVSRQIAALKSRLQRLSPVDATAEYNRMFGDLVALEQQRKMLVGLAAGAL
jgi:DNA primase